MIWSRIANERGNVLLFTIGLLVLMLVMGGIAVDLAYYGVVDNELQRATDAAALAGAGKLGFDDTVFPTVRSFAQNYAAQNPWRNVAVGPTPVSLALNTANDPAGNIVLGVWDPSATPRFSPSVDGTRVNAVLCRTPPISVATTFFRLIGITAMSAFAESIAVANPPATPPPDACLFPIGVGSCPFGEASSQGCGAPITFISSSGQGGAGCLAPPCTNTAAWVNLEGTETANANYLKQTFDEVANGTCASTSLQTGDDIGTNNGMVQDVMDKLVPIFQAKYNASDPNLEITNANGDVTYSGRGWKVYIPVIETACPAGAISGARQIIGWTEMVITQVINNGDCAVSNHWNGGDNPWDPIGKVSNCNGTNSPGNVGSLRALFGYFSCTLIPTNPVPVPTPRTALASKLRLVQ
jgi:Flp pilus assembly protein TadG